jgi:hypothetical protein
MKSMTITIEDLGNGKIRATGRNSGRTVAWRDGTQDNAKSLLDYVMSETCLGHRLDSGYDLTYIELNDAAMAVFNS